ncbi:MAG: hypothetical protein K9I94_08600 [Bacteroidales bacterium]|nr:hypothetical protein [Bacteroidales bacterium]
MKTQRTVIALILGVIFGTFCAWTSSKAPEVDLSTPVLVGLGFNRVILGLVIAMADRIKWHSILRGAVLGIIVSLEVGFSALSNGWEGFFMLVGAGLVYGIIIDFVATYATRKKEVAG